MQISKIDLGVTITVIASVLAGAVWIGKIQEKVDSLNKNEIEQIKKRAEIEIDTRRKAAIDAIHKAEAAYMGKQLLNLVREMNTKLETDKKVSINECEDMSMFDSDAFHSEVTGLFEKEGETFVLFTLSNKYDKRVTIKKLPNFEIDTANNNYRRVFLEPRETKLFIRTINSESKSDSDLLSFAIAFYDPVVLIYIEHNIKKSCFLKKD